MFRDLTQQTALQPVARKTTLASVMTAMTLLEKLLSNASKHFPGRTIFEVVELGGKLPKMSPDTANAYMRTLGSLFRYAQ